MTERRAGKCDLCNADLEIGQTLYTYTTPSTGTLEQARAGEAFWAEDPEWALDEDCHKGVQLFDAGEISREMWIAGQAKKSLMNQHMVIIGRDEDLARQMQEGQIEHIVSVCRSFIDNKSPGFKVEVNAGV